MSDDRKLAMFIDFENIVRGVKEAQYKSFEIKLVLERLVEKGKIMVKRAYADWSRYQEYKRPFHEHAVELIDVPQSRYSGKNSADIRMVVDAMDLAYAKQHVDTFALVSGDSDFSPLVSKLRENDRYVIGIGVKSSSSELLVGNCDEFIFYEDLIREQKKTTALRGPSGEEGGGLRPAHRGGAGAPAREQGHAVGLDGQADHDPEEPRLQRVVLRLLDLLEAPRGGGEAADPHAREGREERHLHHHVPRRGPRGIDPSEGASAAPSEAESKGASAAPSEPPPGKECAGEARARSGTLLWSRSIER